MAMLLLLIDEAAWRDAVADAGKSGIHRIHFHLGVKVMGPLNTCSNDIFYYETDPIFYRLHLTPFSYCQKPPPELLIARNSKKVSLTVSFYVLSEGEATGICPAKSL